MIRYFVITAETIHGLKDELDAATNALTKAHVSMSVKSGAQLFLGYVTRAHLDIPVRSYHSSNLINFISIPTRLFPLLFSTGRISKLVSRN